MLSEVQGYKRIYIGLHVSRGTGLQAHIYIGLHVSRGIGLQGHIYRVTS